MAGNSSWGQANRQQKLGLVWRIRKKITQIIKDYFHLPFFLLIILWLQYRIYCDPLCIFNCTSICSISVCSDDFINQKVYLLRLMPVCVGLIILAAYFCNSCWSQVEFYCIMIKVDWLDACIALRVVGAVLVVFLQRWRKLWTILYQLDSRADTWRNVPNPADQ